MDEFSFINSIKQQTYKQSSVVKGIGDDAAVFRNTSQDIVTAVDTFVEEVHFSRATMDPFHIGYRSLAANISDLAAMGATPAFYLVSIVIPKHWADEELTKLYKGMDNLATIHNMDLIGGDTVSGKELSISITVIGFVSKGNARYRSSAKPGDILFVTGTLGDSQAGFHILNNPGKFKEKEYYYNKHRMPEPRVAFALELGSLSRVALNDISDGIANEANEISEASKVSITIYEDKLPTSTSYKQFPVKLQREWKLFGGEDFELVGTVAKAEWEAMKLVAERTNTPLKEVGYVDFSKSDEHKVFGVNQKNKKKLLEKKGYTHLE
ncbi:thiamine-phosphate kinase [Virgibacillus subterraneus]|uniref:Thiamine-monophosphate kinase n=1 Tax=Virgibacillus subterraneus TaxID=621109 RepID=A0A1H9J216_9BACI|nr:thiamine-phosphate kinase [Virgibacillus subterraneus]SEQ80807.1 thiamine-phosphate kinase [Virgibacillus subterraneus]